jgi:MFS family permease
MLLAAIAAALWFMRDLGFKPKTGISAVTAIKDVARGSIDGGLRNRPVRWLMLAAPFTCGVGVYAFYAMQPYLLELYGDPTAYSIVGIAAAIVAGAQIIGGLTVPIVRLFFKKRTSALILATSLNVFILLGIGFTDSFWIALVLLSAWALTFAIAGPMRQAYLNGIIPSEQRATVLSFDSFMGSIGGSFAQPVLGRVADLSGYAASYLVAAGINVLAIPFVFLARREQASSDPIENRTVAPPV